MKLAITSTGEGMDAAVDPRFGRATYFLVIDAATKATQAVPNTVNLNAAQGAGIQAAKTVAGLGVQALISGHAGPKAFTALQAAGIAVYPVAGGTVAEALAQFQSGALKAMVQADVEGHW